MEFVRTIDVVPNVPHFQPFGLRGKITETDWRDVLTSQKIVVQAARLVFKDAAGRTRKVEQCVSYGGPPPGYMRDSDCQDRK